MGPEFSLPLPDGYTNEKDYVDDLTDFVGSSSLLQLLCGGVHILDFFTREPDLYRCLLPEDWRNFFELHDITDLLDLFLRDDLEKLKSGSAWRGHCVPPTSLVTYICKVRGLALKRDYRSAQNDKSNKLYSNGSAVSSVPHRIALGMKEKKLHEIDNFAQFIGNLIKNVESSTGRTLTHIVDFGSGQNYLGRTLASPPYNAHIIAVESRHDNVEGAKTMDMHANLTPKPSIWRNKKEWREKLNNGMESPSRDGKLLKSEINGKASAKVKPDCDTVTTELLSAPKSAPSTRAVLQHKNDSGGSIQYVEHRLQDGNLATVIDEAIPDQISEEDISIGATQGEASPEKKDDKQYRPNIMVISLHSCGNLTHHGLRSLTLNPSVSAVALVGCCYNLVTERFSPPSYKLPNLRPPAAPSESSLKSVDLSTGKTQEPSNHPNEPQPVSGSSTTTTIPKGDEHGFPMSNRISATNITLNITARMMAVQAPYNWSEADSDRFFTRHFYRALLQKIFLDRGVVEPPSSSKPEDPAPDTAALLQEIALGKRSNVAALGGDKGPGGATQPIIIGNLSKGCYKSFTTYVRGAVAKVCASSKAATLNEDGWSKASTLAIAELVRSRMSESQISDEQIQEYEARYAHRRKHLSVVWSLMAFSATLVEALVVVDRWLWLTEQMDDSESDLTTDELEKRVKWAWVQPVFDYSWSPRNLAIVGIKG